MDLEFTDEQEELRTTLRRFLRDQAPVTPYVRSMLDDPRGTSDDVWTGLADLGVMGMLVPAEHGGAGGTMTDMGITLEELGRAVHPGPFLASAVGATLAIREAGSAADHARWLADLACGRLVGTVALLEGEGRADWHEVATTEADGRLTGTKVWVPDAAGADLLTVSARGDDGPALYAVEADASGLEIREQPTIDGTRRFATVGLRSAPALRLGADTGVHSREPLERVVDGMLLAWVLDGVGAAGGALDRSVDHARERQQFGRAIGSFQAVQHMCADMLREVEIGRAGAYYATWAFDHAEPDERRRAVTMAKAFAAEALPRVGADTIQVHGGIGFTWEHDAHLFYKRLLTLQQVMGDAGDHLDELATLVFG